jgi:predicted transposase/invertase (TIGR01784 family)
MKTNNQKQTQSEWKPFPWGDGEQIPDIRYDQVFKAVFTRDTEKSRGALSDLISALIGKTVAVESIAANEPPADDSRQRYIRFDVACKTRQGELVNVEMSFNPGADEPARLEYYAARLFTGQSLHGKEKKYGNLKETYQITILGKDMFFPDNNLTHTFLYYDPDSRVPLGGKTRIITVELVKTKPIAGKPVEEMTNAEAWAVFFTYLTDKEKRAKIVEIINHEEGIAMAVQTLGKFTQSEIDYIQETYRLKRKLDQQSGMAWERERLRATKEKVRAAMEKGMEKGREAERAEVARNALAQGLTPEFVQKITGLDMQTITSFR